MPAAAEDPGHDDRARRRRKDDGERHPDAARRDSSLPRSRRGISRGGLRARVAVMNRSEARIDLLERRVDWLEDELASLTGLVAQPEPAPETPVQPAAVWERSEP